MDKFMETKKVLIDTSILIDYFRKKNKSKTIFYRLSLENMIYISAITEFEFLIGVKENHIDIIKKIFNMNNYRT